MPEVDVGHLTWIMGNGIHDSSPELGPFPELSGTSRILSVFIYKMGVYVTGRTGLL